MRRILFLDFDGVLNSQDWYVRRGEIGGLHIPRNQRDDFDPAAGALLKSIVDRVPKLEIVVSSTWRLNADMATLRDYLSPFGIPRGTVVDKTPRFPGEVRGKEIKAWLDKNVTDICTFVILDDDRDMEPIMGNLIKTDNKIGLTAHEAEEVVRRLNADA